MFNILILFTLLFCAGGTSTKTNMPRLWKIFDFLSHDGSSTSNQTKAVEDMSLEELGVSRGTCEYDFIKYVGHGDESSCAIDDHYILHLLPATNSVDGTRKPPIMVKCLAENPIIANKPPKLYMMASVKQIVEMLTPQGDATKRHEPGSCVLVYFYTPTCLACAHMAIHINSLPHAFPTLPAIAIDAYQFPSFNTEFGIVGLPTLLLFHQGRPVVKYKADVSFNAFVTRHTGIRPIKFHNKPSTLEPLPSEPVKSVDFALILSWAFILTCAGYLFARSELCRKIVEAVERNWRESEAQLEHN